MKARLAFVHALSPLHAGTGQGVGVIDLPIAREKATGIPYLPGSSFKGVLRDACSDRSTREEVFGPDTASPQSHASSVAFCDLRLLLLPVRSVAGTFAWVTSPYILLRLVRDLDSIGAAVPTSEVPQVAMAEAAVASSESVIVHGDQVLIEDLDLAAKRCPEVEKWAEWIGKQVFPDAETWQEFLKQRICVVNDDVLRFLLNTATEVFARIRLKSDVKTVQKGGLWYEEALPAETILCGIVAASPVKVTPERVFAVLDELVKEPLQLGGKATVGAGFCRVLLTGGV
ncbi:MAG TPA: type III-B CRISPR module RAMP protein Cmr4 [Bacillota bacterium]|mgnify:FL=1|jgi:CRISPR-associated protein Cmr4|nr:type III-B CRISPR module RAMP protein Cmr4 [Bacillota bacterium]